MKKIIEKLESQINHLILDYADEKTARKIVEKNNGKLSFKDLSKKEQDYIVQYRKNAFEEKKDIVENIKKLKKKSENMLDLVLTFSEATQKWGLADSTLREAKSKKRFKEDETRKSGSTNLITYEAMKRLYGEPKK